MNGKKGKAVSFVVVAFLLCGVFGGLVTEQALGYYVGCKSGTGRTTYSAVYYFNRTLTVPDGYEAVFDDFHIYVNGTGLVGVGVYGLDGYLLGQSNNVSVGVSAAWVRVPFELSLLNGTYVFAVGFGTSVTWYKDEGFEAGQFSNGLTFNDPYVSGGDVDYGMSWYADYDFEALASDVVDSSWLGVGVSLALVVVSLALALKSRSWAVNFLFGLSTVGFLGWTFANTTTELFGGWLLFMVLVGAVLVLVKGAVLVRASGV